MTATKTKSKLAGKNPAEARPSRAKLLLYGLPGTGKTWGALSFPRCLYIDTEAGANLPPYTRRLSAGGGRYIGPEDGALDFDFVIGQFAALASEQHEFETVVVDSVSKLFNTSIAAEAERLGARNQFGADKKPALRAMARLMQWVQRIDCNVVFLAHEKPVWGEVNGQRAEIGRGPDVDGKLEYELNLVLQLVKTPSGRQAITRKSRLEGFQHGQAFPWEFAEFQSRYEASLEGAAQVEPLVQPAMLTEIGALIALVKTPEEELDKMKLRAGVSDFAELTADKATKLRDWLQKKITDSLIVA